VSRSSSCFDKPRIDLVVAIVAVVIAASTILGDVRYSNAMAPEPKKFNVLISVESSARVTLVDRCGRRDGWRDGKVVAEIPGCSRGSAPPETMIEGGSDEAAPNTELTFGAIPGQGMRLLVDAVKYEEVRVFLQVVGVREKSGCGAEEFAQVTKGRRYVWNLGWGILADSCWASIRRHGNAPARSGASPGR